MCSRSSTPGCACPGSALEKSTPRPVLASSSRPALLAPGLTPTHPLLDRLADKFRNGRMLIEGRNREPAIQSWREGDGRHHHVSAVGGSPFLRHCAITIA